jgi:hypothetical protein
MDKCPHSCECESSKLSEVICLFLPGHKFWLIFLEVPGLGQTFVFWVRGKVFTPL